MQQPPSDVPTAPGVPVVTRTVEEILETLPEDLDERLDLLGKYQLWLEDLNQKNPENAYIKAFWDSCSFKWPLHASNLGPAPQTMALLSETWSGPYKERPSSILMLHWHHQS